MSNSTQPIKILIVCTSHVLPTGMSETLRLVFGTLLRDYPEEYEIREVGLFLMGGVVEPLWPIYPTHVAIVNQKRVLDPEDAWGQRTFNRACKEFKPDLVFAFNDPQKVEHLCISKDQRDYGLILHTNIDSVPLANFQIPFDVFDRVVTVSKFALSALRQAHGEQVSEEHSAFMYHPADTERFHPISESEKLENREELFPESIPEDAFVLGWVGQNQWRKQVWLAYEVIHYIRKGGYRECKACSRVSLFLWDTVDRSFTEPEGPASQAPTCAHCGSLKVISGVPLDNAFLWLHMASDCQPTWIPSDLEDLYDLRADREVYYTEGLEDGAAQGPPGLSPSDMPLLYQMWDAVLYLTGGEGFGIPPWEAMCTETPVIYTNYSSHAEFLNEARAGIPVSGTAVPTPEAGPFYMMADTGQAVEAVLRLYRNRELGATLGKNGRQFVQQYDLKNQAAKWQKIFSDVLNEA